MTRQEIMALRKQVRDEFDADQAAAKRRCDERLKALDVVEAMLPLEEQRVTPPDGRTDNAAPEPAFANLTMIDAVQHLFDLYPNRVWTVTDVERKLREHEFPFTAANVQGSLNTALGRLLHDRHVIEIVRRGSGRRPTVYRRAGGMARAEV